MEIFGGQPFHGRGFLEHMVRANLRILKDDELSSGYGDLVIDERENLLLQFDYIAELDRRKLFFQYNSLKAFLVEEKGLEEWVAEKRIRLARILARHPELWEKLLLGKLNTTLIELAQGCAYREKLSDTDFLALTDAISGMSCRAAMREIACRYPRTANLPPDRIRPLNENESELRCRISNDLVDDMDVLRELTAVSHPGATLGEVIHVAVKDFNRRNHPVEKAMRAQARKEKRTAAVGTPAADDKITRRQPRVFSEAQGHEMILAQGYRCRYVDPVSGMRCSSSFAIQKDHIQAWHDGGKTILSNARFLCPGHHRRVTFLRFGDFKGPRKNN